MPLQLRQICLVANELAPVIDDLTSILGVNSAYIDEGVGQFGLENKLLAIGRNFLEVVAPIEENTAGGRYLDRRGGDGGYMVITQADSGETYDAMRQRAEDNNVRVAWKSERENWNLTQFHPRDMVAAFLEVECGAANDFNGNWMPVGFTGWEDKVKQDVTVNFIGAELQSDNPLELATLWGNVIGTPCERDGDQFTVELNNVTLRFVTETDGRGPGLGGLDISVANRDAVLAEARNRGCYVSDDQVLICGTRFYLHDA
jgi:hypothetical protein